MAGMAAIVRVITPTVFLVWHPHATHSPRALF
jgi:hypothetical protein